MMMRALSVGFLSLFLFAGAAGATKVGDRAADFSLKDLSGQTVKLSDLRGKVVLLDFWASWCAPCRKELPALDQMAARYKKAGKDVVILAVNIDKDRAKARRFLQEARVKNVRVLLDPQGAVASRYELPTMPTSFVIDQRGIVREVTDGYRSGDEKKLQKVIDGLLK